MSTIALGSLNTFVPITSFIYPMKISENLKVLLCFQGVEKGYIGNKWVNSSIITCNTKIMIFDDFIKLHHESPRFFLIVSLLLFAFTLNAIDDVDSVNLKFLMEDYYDHRRAWNGNLSHQEYLLIPLHYEPYPSVGKAPTKQKHTKTTLRQQPTNCLNIFDRFLRLKLKGLTVLYRWRS